MLKLGPAIAHADRNPKESKFTLTKRQRFPSCQRYWQTQRNRPFSNIQIGQEYFETCSYTTILMTCLNYPSEPIIKHWHKGLLILTSSTKCFVRCELPLKTRNR